MSKSDVKEEYKEAFRTKSYIEISNKVQDLVRVESLDEEKLATATSSTRQLQSPSPPTTHHIHLSQYLLEPYQKPSTSISDNSNFHQFFVNYFEISQEACTICESLLTNLKQVRKNHRRIKKAIKMIRRLSDANPTLTNDEYRVLYKNFASFAAQRNPFSTTTTTDEFRKLHEAHALVFQELTSTCRKLKRRTKMIKHIKKAMAFLVLMGFGALVVVALVLAMHCTVGLVAAPGLVVLSLMVKKMRRVERSCNDKWLERAAAELDAAARGVFTTINDLATMSRIVKRLEDEIEHRRYVADVCVRKGKNETLKEVVRKFEMQECCFVEELEELEKQIYLCFLDINRSRKLLVGKMVISV